MRFLIDRNELPYDAMVSIKGKVKLPMYYEMKKTESLASLLNYAGGFSSDAYKKMVRVIRNGDTKRKVFNVGDSEGGGKIMDATREAFMAMWDLD